MNSGFTMVRKLAGDVIRRADRLKVNLNQFDDGWALEGMPFTMTQLGYPTLEISAAPDQVRSLSLKEADHYLYLCEQRVRDSQPRPRRYESLFR